jgi:hypothetical protein
VGQWLTLLCHHPHRPINPTTAFWILFPMPYSNSYHPNYLRMIGNSYFLFYWLQWPRSVDLNRVIASIMQPFHPLLPSLTSSAILTR